MNKSISISLGGFAFFIEEEAYMKLQHYINAVKNSLLPDDDINEIINDIEIRIAELFKSYLNNTREVIDINDVDQIITIMGTPEQFDTNEETSFTEPKEKKKKLFRDTDDRFLGGVCSGIAHYIGLDVVWIRIATILLIITGIAAMPVIICYLIVLIVVPEAHTTSEKLQMRGQSITFDSIKNWNEIEKASSKLSKRLSPIFETIGNIFVKLFGVGFVIIGIAIIGSVITFTELMVYLPFEFGGTGKRRTIGLFLAYFIVLIPALSFLFTGIRIIFNKIKLVISPIFTTSILVTWIVAIIAFANFALFSHDIFIKEEVERKTIMELNEIKNDTLIVQAKRHNNLITHKGTFPLFGYTNRETNIEGDLLFIKIKNELEIAPSKDDQFHIETAYVSNINQGENANDALNQIKYNYTIEDNILTIDTYLAVTEQTGYKHQDVRVTLYVPEGKYIHNKDIEHFYYNHGNGWHDTWHQHNTTFIIQKNKMIRSDQAEEKERFKGEFELSDKDNIKSLQITVQ